MATPADEIKRLEKLLVGLKARFIKGEKDLAKKIRYTSARLQKLKLQEEFREKKSEKKKTQIRESFLFTRRRRCCGR